MANFKQPESNPRTEQKEIVSKRCGLRHTIFSVNGDKYTGEWLNDMKHGKGTQVWKKGAMYDGEWKFGKQDGCGTYSVLPPGSTDYTKKYSGEWKSGKKHGNGKYFYNDVSAYEGEWSEDQRNGSGRMYFENGDIYEGEWMHDQMHGQGFIQFSNGNCYDGNWKDGKRNGDGKFFYTDRGVLYEGFWVDGMAKCGTMTEFRRDEASAPSTPFPKLLLKDPERSLREAKAAIMDNERC
ncbi:MORN repeat-containing protein 3 [Nematolebias whitei]|uniref:MORN repeat-containing protein 3 n=1 Tax=Nematolebias whitei TaxID=451745 RepID=UPI0018983424|nr:MORN repeat-containing protein 3 [Nematolebias whitei]